MIFLFFFPVPPSKIELAGYETRTRLIVKENEEVELKCVVHEAKPKAKVVWYRHNTVYRPGEYKVTIILSCTFTYV